MYDISIKTLLWEISRRIPPILAVEQRMQVTKVKQWQISGLI